MKILLISPGSPDDIDSQIIQGIPYLFAKAFFAPHAVAAVAALTPPEHEVEIHDEYIRGPVETILQHNTYDIIGVSIATNQVTRCLHIAGQCRKYVPTATIVAGGIGVENLIHNHTADFDTVFHGEAEDTWPQFLEDYRNGTTQPMYKNSTKPDMTKVPAPRWELIERDIPLYNTVSVQTTRGCPFDCSFCDVIYTYGRQPRSKTIDQVLHEIEKLHAMKVPMIFLADDNFSGNKKYAKALLKKITVLNNGYTTPIGFLTQLDITIARDDELLELMADSNFYAVMIGIESMDEGALKDLNKRQNLQIDITGAIQKIQSYGIIVLGHMIVGADSDNCTAFERIEAFINKANIVHHFCHPLTAPPGTKLWYNLKRQGRIIAPESDNIHDKLDIITNIVPKQMTRVELFEGLADYWENIYKPHIFMQRAVRFIKAVKRKPKVRTPGTGTLWRLRKMLFRTVTFYLFRVSKEHRRAFFSLLRTSCRHAAYLVPKTIYLYTCYLMDYTRACHDARIVREHAQWEREHGNRIKIDSCVIPVSEKIRDHASDIFNTAYYRVRKKTAHRDTLYKTVIEAMIDYSDRFGSTFETFDKFQEEYIHSSCDRVIQQYLTSPDTRADMPKHPPAGFAREIMDVLDTMVRIRNKPSAP